jgi:SPP1 gp7 family putative phage head morphogenesis protein
MPTPNVDLATLIKLPPQDAIDYFKAKGYLISFNWQEVWQGAHARSFTVAKAMRADILQAIRLEVEKALTEGITEREFIKTLEPQLKKLGWWGKQFVTDSQGNTQQVQLGSAHRLKTIYRTNTQTAYMAGRYKQQMENSDQQPYWMYVAVMDSRTRPSHAALNGKVFRFDDPFWQIFYPPNGWGCRCRVRAISERRLKQLKLSVETSTGKLTNKTLDAGFDKASGEIYPAQVTTFNDGRGNSMTPDKGWNYNVGMSAFGQDIELMRKLTQIKDAVIRQQAIQALNNSELRHQAFATWITNTLAKRQAGHGVQTLGFLDENLAKSVIAKGFATPSRVLVINEKNVLHADSKKHQDKGIALNQTEYQQLPKMLAQPQAVLWDNKHNNLLFIYPSENNNKIKMVVNAPYGIKKLNDKLDVLINAYKINAFHLMNGINVGVYEVLVGNL